MRVCGVRPSRRLVPSLAATLGAALEARTATLQTRGTLAARSARSPSATEASRPADGRGMRSLASLTTARRACQLRRPQAPSQPLRGHAGGADGYRPKPRYASCARREAALRPKLLCVRECFGRGSSGPRSSGPFYAQASQADALVSGQPGSPAARLGVTLEEHRGRLKSPVRYPRPPPGRRPWPCLSNAFWHAAPRVGR
jgi:hypothetical protein